VCSFVSGRWLSLGLMTVLCAVSVTILVFWDTSPETLHPVTGRNQNAVRQIIPDLFEGFNNETGAENGTYLVPNIIHFLRFKQNNLTFVDAVCVLSAFKNHRPDKILFHTDFENFVGPTGKR